MIGRFVAVVGDPVRSPPMRHAPLSLSQSLILATGVGALAGCQPATLPVAGTTHAGNTAVANDARFDAVAESLLMRALQRSPEWSIYSGRYDDAATLTIPDATRRGDVLAFSKGALAELAAFTSLH